MANTEAQESALEIGKSVSVRASAGTGKTYLLKERYIKLLENVPGLDPEEILCLTFTDKAAAEMRERIENEIRKRAKEPESKLKDVLPRIHRCCISTFHGFCSQVLKEFPLEAGVPVGFSVMDDLDRTNLVSQIMTEVLEHPPAGLEADVKNLFIHYSRNIKKSISALLKLWPDPVCRHWFETIRTKPEEVYEQWRENAVLPKKKQGMFPAFDDPRTQLMFTMLNAVARVTEYIFDRIEEEKKKEGLLNFDDLIAKTLALIVNNPGGAADVLRERFRFILVDEVQDNDPALTKIVQELAGDPKKSAKLFIVGDIKQSIYGFKGAKPEEVADLYNSFDGVVNLNLNFRTLPDVQNVINTVFMDVFRDSADVPYTEAVEAHRKDNFGTVTVIENLTENRPTAADMVDQADILASWIRRSVEEKTLTVRETGTFADYRDFTVLVHKRKQAEPLKDAFRRYGVPFTEYKGRGFYSAQEIYDFVYVIKAAVWPEDDVSLYGALRSPYFGISDAKLAAFGSPSYDNPDDETLRDRLNKADDAEIRAALDCLKCLSQASVSKPLPEFLHEIIEKTGILSVYAGVENGIDKIGNIEKLVDIAAERSQNCGESVFEFISMVDSCMDMNVQEEEVTGTDSSDNRVKIMTIHASKGLEFPVTVLAFAEKTYRAPTQYLLYDEKAGPALNSLRYPGEEEDLFKPVSGNIKSEQRKKELAELKRLFYVAMTRVSDHLVLCTTHQYTVSEIETKSDSFMKFYRTAIPPYEGENVIHEPDERKAAPYMPHGVPEFWKPLSVSEAEVESDTVHEPDVPAEILRRGSCVHEIFAGGDVKDACRKYGFAGLEQMFIKQYEAFLASDLMADAAESWCELPVRTVEGRRKVIDRLVRKKDGSYMIIDYKNAAQITRESGPEKQELLEQYRNQLTVYAELLCEILHVEKIPAYLYFILDESVMQVV